MANRRFRHQILITKAATSHLRVDATKGRGYPRDPRDPRMGSFFQFCIVKIGTLCFLPSPLCGEMGGRGLKHCKTQYFWHLDFRRGFPGAQEAQAPPSGARDVFPNNVFLTNEPSKNDGEMLSTSFCSKFRCASF